MPRAARSADAFRVFSYGTLEAADVMRAVTGREFPAIAALLAGYARYRVRGRAYPGALREGGATTPGTLYTGVDAAALARLDAFEGDAYERCDVCVRTRDGETSAFAYLYRAERADQLTSEPWDRERFLASRSPGGSAASAPSARSSVRRMRAVCEPSQ